MQFWYFISEFTSLLMCEMYVSQNIVILIHSTYINYNCTKISTIA